MNNKSADLTGNICRVICTFEPPHDKTNKMAYAPSEDSDHGWTDELVLYIPSTVFQSFWDDGRVNMKRHLGLGRISPPAGFEPTTPWSEVGSANRSATRTLQDSDQPGHPPSQIRVVTVRKKKAWVLSYPWSTWQRLWLDWADTQADLSWLGTQSFCGFCHEAAHFFFHILAWNGFVMNLKIIWRHMKCRIYEVWGKNPLGN